MPLVPWTYSRLDSFETCPKKFYLISVAKTVKDEGNEHTQYGTEMHLAFANYMKKGKVLPLQFQQYQKHLAPIAASPGEKIVEQKLAINAKYEPTGWFDKDVWLRVISDLTQFNGDKGIIWDWKSGKLKNDFTQLRLVSAVMFLLAPVESITMAYFWAKTRQITSEKITRAEMPKVFDDMAPRVAKYQQAHVDNEFPPRPGYLCRYCPVKSCPYNDSK